MKCKYSLTFEFETAAPITVKGESEATSVRTIAARALDDAVKQNPKSKWSSIVLVIERDFISNELKDTEEQNLTNEG